jgi:hypothetical protein
MRRMPTALQKPVSPAALTCATLYDSALYDRTLDRLACPTTPETVETIVANYRENGVAVARTAIRPAAARLMRHFASDYQAEMELRIVRGDRHISIDHYKQQTALIWEARVHERYFLTQALEDILASPLWLAMLEIADGGPIAIPLSHMVLRGSVDALDASLGAHQDAVDVNPDVPYNLWIALEAMAPKRISSLGFLAEPIGTVYSKADAVARSQSLAHRMWLPSYEPGDVALFNNTTLHQTTSYGTGTQRWSVELRYMRADRIPTGMAGEAFIVVSEEAGKRSIQLANLPVQLDRYIRTNGFAIPPF